MQVNIRSEIHFVQTKLPLPLCSVKHYIHKINENTVALLAAKLNKSNTRQTRMTAACFSCS